MTVLTYEELLALLEEMTAGGSGLDPAVCMVGLYASTDREPQPSLTLAEVHEVNYGGYAQQALGAWATPRIAQDARPVIESAPLTFAPTDSSAADTALGYFIVNTDGTDTLRVISPFATPVQLRTPTDFVTVTPSVEAPFAGGWGEAIFNS